MELGNRVAITGRFHVGDDAKSNPKSAFDSDRFERLNRADSGSIPESRYATRIKPAGGCKSRPINAGRAAVPRHFLGCKIVSTRQPRSHVVATTMFKYLTQRHYPVNPIQFQKAPGKRRGLTEHKKHYRTLGIPGIYPHSTSFWPTL